VDLNERLARDHGVLDRLGIAVTESPTGGLDLRLRVTADMLNASEVCHGGMLFALADSACAYALAAAGVAPVTVDASITYLRAARIGDEVSTATDVLHTGRRLGHCQVRLTLADGTLVADYRATCANVAD